MAPLSRYAREMKLEQSADRPVVRSGSFCVYGQPRLRSAHLMAIAAWGDRALATESTQSWCTPILSEPCRSVLGGAFSGQPSGPTDTWTEPGDAVEPFASEPMS